MKHLYFLATCVVALLIAAPAFAQSTEGRVHVGLEVPLFEVDALSFDDELSPDRVTVSGGLSVTTGRVNLGLGLGELFVLGLRASSGSKTFFTESAIGDRVLQETFLSLMPYLEIGLSSDARLLPFVGPTAGAELSLVEEEDQNSTEAVVLGRFGAVFGLRIFVTEEAAIEPSLSVTYGIGTTRVEVDDETIADADFDRFMLRVNIGGALWLGGRAPRAERPPPEEPAALPPSPSMPPAAPPAEPEPPATPAPPASDAPSIEPPPPPPPAQPAEPVDVPPADPSLDAQPDTQAAPAP